MNTLARQHVERLNALKQRGVVLFLTLVALLAMSLAAVALIRSVDTSTMIAGNLAFKQAATSSGDAGIEAGIIWLKAMDDANSDLDAFSDIAHPFNTTNLGARPGYHSNVNPALDLTADATWTDPDFSMDIPVDATGNTVRYTIHRMCRTADQTVTNAHCLFGSDPESTESAGVKLPSEICEPESPGCPPAGQSPLYRITARTDGPKNSVSYVQAFVN